MPPQLPLPHLGQHFQICAGGFGDHLGIAGVYGGQVDQVAADSQCARAGFEKALRGLQGDAASGNELDVREGRELRFQVACAAHCRAGKDLDVVRARVKGRDDLGGCERAGDRDLA